MKLQEIIQEKIQSLESVIEFRSSDDKWKTTTRDKGEDNEYFWRFCGEREYYCGKVAALQNLLEEISGDKK